VILTRRRGGAEEEAEEQGKSKPESTEAAEIFGLRREAHAIVEAGENAKTENQRVAGGFPERRQFDWEEEKKRASWGEKRGIRGLMRRRASRYHVKNPYDPRHTP
jgi:hypothetical protein